MSFQQHLKDAIKLNKQRASYYQSQTQGRSRHLSRKLIALEYLALPLAAYFDKQAQGFNKEGIMIMKDDFLPRNVAHETRAPPYTAVFNQALYKQLKQKHGYNLKQLHKTIKSKDDLESIYQQGKAYLGLLKQHQQNHQIHLSMTQHVLESLIFIAKNAIYYAEHSEGKTVGLSKKALNLHCFSLNYSLAFDKEANSFHQQGVGIIYNDLPEYDDL